MLKNDFDVILFDLGGVVIDVSDLSKFQAHGPIRLKALHDIHTTVLPKPFVQPFRIGR